MTTIAGDPDVLSLFEQEAADRLGRLGDGLLDLERHGNSPDVVASLFREAHTLKGAAEMVGLQAVATAAHQLEEILAAVRAGERMVSPELVDELFDGIDGLISLTGVAVRPDPVDEDSDEESLPPASRRETARVAVDRLDDLVRLAGESVAAHLRLAQRVREDLGVDPASVSEMRSLTRLLADLQERTLKARMLPLGSVAMSLRRAARDLARKTGKQVRCVVRGEDTELDRSVHERLADALIHMVRNAVDHGLEDPATRVAAGKPAEGEVLVHATQLGSRIVVTVSDDGAGIDTAKLRRRAEEFGIETYGMNDAAVHQLIFRSGVSTAKVITDVSGRGVGLDAVHEQLEALRGRIEVESTPGAGTRFRISVPITLSVLQGLVVEAGGQRMTLPMQHVVTVLDSDAVVLPVQGRPSVRALGKIVPLSPLAELLGLTPLNEGPIVVLSGLEHTYAVRVDQLHGRREVLLKALPDIIPPLDAVVGASAEPDGTVMLVLDAEAVVNAGAATGPAFVPNPVIEHDNTSVVADTDVTTTRGRVLVVDDALTVRELQRSILERAGYRVRTAVDGRDALRQLSEDVEDLVLTDIEMPGMNGLDLTRSIRRHRQLSNIPVVILTSRVSEDDRQRGLDAGADAYIVKSAFDEAALLGVVENLLGSEGELMRAPIKVVVVEDSYAQRVVLRRSLEAEGDIVVVGEATTVAGAVASVTCGEPDVVTVDLNLPGGGRLAVERIMRSMPRPILVLGRHSQGLRSPEAREAIGAGAAALLKTPLRWDTATEEALRSRVRALRDSRAKNAPRSAAPSVALATEATPRAEIAPRAPRRRGVTSPVVAIAASTGGPPAVAQVLQQLQGVDVPVVLVQHIDNRLVDGLADWLARTSGWTVSVAVHGTMLRPGEVLVGPGGRHLTIDARRCAVLEPSDESGHCPSADRLFSALARNVGQHTVAALLTGMGNDGAEGMLAVHRAGGFTIAQDESSSAVFGMPRAAVALGAARQVVPLAGIGPAIVRALRGRRHE